VCVFMRVGPAGSSWVMILPGFYHLYGWFMLTRPCNHCLINYMHTQLSILEFMQFMQFNVAAVPWFHDGNLS